MTKSKNRKKSRALSLNQIIFIAISIIIILSWILSLIVNL